MPAASRCAFLAVFAAVLSALPAFAEKKTVCTITVNSADEREAFRQNLPRDRFRFVELVERGRADWLRSSCQRDIQCDVLVISGHFNAGDDFYSDRVDTQEYLRVDELERAACSESCPGLFARLKEVYLFGCESLNPDSTRYASSYGESGRERMRRIFANVPVIYGFSSSAPVGPTAAMLLNRYFDTGAKGEIGSGRASTRLLAVFARNSMTRTAGVGDAEGVAAQRRQICQFFDERIMPAQKLEFIHRMMRRDMTEARAFFDRIEKLYASVDGIDRQSPDFVRALDAIARDAASRDRFLALARDADRPEMRARMLELARAFGWLSPQDLRTEHLRLVSDLLARSTMSFADVGTICSLNKDRELDAEQHRLKLPAAGIRKLAQTAALACLGNAEAHAQVLRAMGSADTNDVQIAQAYFRYRPMTDASELRTAAQAIARMSSTRAQVRALDTLARHQISDREVQDELIRSFTAARSVSVQRAIAEIFIRSDPRAIARPELAGLLRQHRLKSPDGEDLIDVLIRRLQHS